MHWTDRCRETITALEGLLNSLGCTTHLELVVHARIAIDECRWYEVGQAIESLASVAHGNILHELNKDR